MQKELQQIKNTLQELTSDLKEQLDHHHEYTLTLEQTIKKIDVLGDEALDMELQLYEYTNQ